MAYSEIDKLFLNLITDMKKQFIKPLNEMMLQVKSQTPIRTGRLFRAWHRQVRIKDQYVVGTIRNVTPYGIYPAYWERDGKTRYVQGKKYYETFKDEFGDVKMKESVWGSFTPVGWELLNNEGIALKHNLEKWVVGYLRGKIL
jgi:hypothetical protein